MITVIKKPIRHSQIYQLGKFTAFMFSIWGGSPSYTKTKEKFGEPKLIKNGVSKQ